MSARVFIGAGGGENGDLVKDQNMHEQDCPDANLVEAAQGGDGDAFGLLVERYHRQVYGIVYRMCGAGEAEDISQEIFVRALQALRHFKYQGQASFRTWLYRIAVNASINELRKRKRRGAVTGPSLDEFIETENGRVSRSVPDETQMPHVIVEREEEKRAVRAVMRTLSPKHQAVLALVDLEGMDYEEAARTVGCPLGTLKSRVARARDAFAAQYRRYMQGTLMVDDAQGDGSPVSD